MTSLVDVCRSGAIQRNLLRLMVSSQVFKFGEFILKSGQKSPIYIDLRECFGVPELMRLVSEAISEKIQSSQVVYSGIVGVPYAALPYASVVAADHLSKPLLIVRKEAKSYGTKKLIEGTYAAGDEVIIIEDVVTTGGSILEVLKQLHAEGLVVKHVFCILDREQGGAKILEDAGVQLHSLLNMETIMNYLYSTDVVDEDALKQISEALNLSHITPQKLPVSAIQEDIEKFPFVSVPRTNLKDRLTMSTSPLNQKIINLMIKKESNLCLAIDYTTTEKVLKLVEKAGPFVVAIKLHADIIEDFSEEFVKKLVNLANDHEFVIFEDRKFADTGNTNLLQLRGYQKIAEWADVVTVHAVQGSESIAGVFRELVNDPKYRLSGVLIIAQLSTKGSLTALPGYTRKVAEIAENNRDVVAGFIAQTRVSAYSDLLNWTPGVNLDVRSDNAGQQWRDAKEAIELQQNDIVIVGRGVTSSDEPVQQLKRYRGEAWSALVCNDVTAI